MTQKPTLLVLAAGMGSRYGSLKQVDRFGPSGETITDYSVFDAIRTGFGKIVFVIRESIGKEFYKAIIANFADRILIETVYQELNILPEGFKLPENRTKPWGTGHAVWVAASKINEPFAVINTDDFYGYQSFRSMADFLQNNDELFLYSLMGYQLSNTLSKYGAVSRGICQIDEKNELKSIVEHKYIAETENGIVTRTSEGQELQLRGDEIVSMNMMGFNPSVFPFFESGFKEFLARNGQDPKAEFYLPEVVNNLIKSRAARIKVLLSTERWFGVTYAEDKPLAIENLKNLTESGIYPENLWTNAGKEN